MACRLCGGELPATAFHSLLDVNNHTLDLWVEMVYTGVKLTEGLCIGILARSTESNFLCFAEEVAKYCREKCMMAIAVYGAVLKAMPSIAFTVCLRSVPADHRERPHARRDHVRVPYVRLRAARQDGTLAGALSHAPRLDTQYYMSLFRVRPRQGY